MAQIKAFGRLSILLGWVLSMLMPFPTFAQTILNGFVIDEPLVPADLIFHGGPPRDGIPPIDNPVFLKDTANLDRSMRVVGVSLNGVAKAYPINILNYHEIVNDVFEDEPISITYCPLCATAVAFKGKYGKEMTSFGVSGLLFNSDLLMYDRRTDSLWSQIEGKAINGPAKGIVLDTVPVMHVTLEAWLAKHPNSMILSEQTGHSRNYGKTPYTGYEASSRIYFPVTYEDKRYHPKELVLGIEVAGRTKAFPFSELSKRKIPFIESFGKQVIKIHFDQGSSHAYATDVNGQLVKTLTAYWFAWYTFHPQTEVFRASTIP